MIFRTHLVFGFLCGLIAYDYLGLSQWWFFIFVLIGAGIPDVDEPESRWGRKLGFLSEVINFIFRHRGVFHSVFLGGAVGYVLGVFFNKMMGVGFFVGFVSHLIGDGFTLKGINFIYPFKQLRLSGFIRTGSKLESILFYIILVIDVLMLAKFLS